MRRITTYILVVAGVLAVALSCRREGSGEVVMQDIRITPTVGNETKAIINNTAYLNQNGSQIQVYDVVTGFTGSINNQSYTNATVDYISDVLTYADGSWTFPDLTYPWTRTGVHHFYGWLAYDKQSDMTSAAKVNPSYTNHVLSIPTKTITSASDQFDFLYSRNIAVRDAASKDYSVVPLNMAHLFSAFALSVENKSNEPIKLLSVSMPGLPVMNGSATIDYTPGSNTAPVVTYSGPSAGATHFFENPIPAGGVTLAKKTESNRRVNAFTGAFINDESAPIDYRLLWPVSADVLAPTTPNTTHTDPSDRYASSLNEPTDSLIRISYSFMVTPDVGEPYEIVRNDIGVKLPYVAFSPGKKTSINVTINDKVVDLTFVVQEWDVSEYALDFSSASATVTSSFEFTEGTYSEKVGDYYYTNGANAIEGKFKITNPVGARIYVNPKGDAGYFTITLNHQSVDPTVDLGEIVVSVKPNTSHGTPSGDKKLQLSFYVMNGQQEINIDSEVRCEGTIVWSN